MIRYTIAITTASASAIGATLCLWSDGTNWYALSSQGTWTLS